MSSIAPSSSASQTPDGSDPDNFNNLIRQHYPYSDQTSISTAGVKRRRRTKGPVEYLCKACRPEWSTPYRANAVRHCLKTHPISDLSSPSQPDSR